jgi:hypothetical protein
MIVFILNGEIQELELIVIITMMWDRVRPLKELVEAECIEYKNRYLKKRIFD